RGIKAVWKSSDPDAPTPDGQSIRDSDIKRTDTELWKGWVGSSTNFAGSVLQLAASKELGGRYRELPTHSTDLIKQANEKYKSIGGFDGVKALVRAKWEVSQFLLDKAGIHTVEVYRGLKINMSDEDREKIQEVEVDKWEDKASKTSGATMFERIPDVNIVRNGAMSTTTSASVANSWSAGSGQKVVIRLDAPRTSVLSIPAYGENNASEKEVVVAGTAWNQWDAWKNNAPTFEQSPMKAAA
ncbi:MAG TPA: hypothetical protein VK603_16130, partial [Candidatus Saccharimonadales bacterium]|nr:hypothetical protein [Candidatus Saccharimonadales bacterium]